MSGDGYTITGTVGQPDAGETAGGMYDLLGGFWNGGPLCFVEMEDFALFAFNWLDGPCDVDNNWCNGADLDNSGDVTVTDLRDVAYYWLDYCPVGWPLN